MLEQKGKWGGEHYLLQRTCPYFYQVYPLMMAGYGSCFLFVCLFVCLYVFCFMGQGKVEACNDNVAGKKRAIPSGKNRLVRSGNQSEHAIYFLYCAPSRSEG